MLGVSHFPQWDSHWSLPKTCLEESKILYQRRPEKDAASHVQNGAPPPGDTAEEGSDFVCFRRRLRGMAESLLTSARGAFILVAPWVRVCWLPRVLPWQVKCPPWWRGFRFAGEPLSAGEVRGERSRRSKDPRAEIARWGGEDWAPGFSRCEPLCTRMTKGLPPGPGSCTQHPEITPKGKEEGKGCVCVTESLGCTAEMNTWQICCASIKLKERRESNGWEGGTPVFRLSASHSRPGGSPRVTWRDHPRAHPHPESAMGECGGQGAPGAAVHGTQRLSRRPAY